MIRKTYSYLAATLTLGLPLDAFAYLDAGTGSMIIQGLIGALVAGIYVIKLNWHRLLILFGVRKKTVDEADAKVGEENTI